MDFYPTPAGNLPRVTQILSATDSANDKAALRRWGQKPESKGILEQAAARGTTIHKVVELFILDGVIPSVDKELQPFIDPIIETYSRFVDPVWIWVEKPVKELREVYRHCFYEYRGQDGRVEERACVWYTKNGKKYGGCPDQIVGLDGKNILIDIKSSLSPYRKTPAQRPANFWFALQNKEDDEHYEQAKKIIAEYKQEQSRYKSYRKCTFQLAAYKAAIQETLGITIDECWIMNATPGKCYFFRLKPQEEAFAEKEWFRRLDEYYGLKAS